MAAGTSCTRRSFASLRGDATRESERSCKKIFLTLSQPLDFQSHCLQEPWLEGFCQLWRCRPHKYVSPCPRIFSPVPALERLNHKSFMQSSTNTTPLRQKRPRLKLGPKEYAIIRKRALNRNSWRGQKCGSMKGLEVHHMKRRSRLGGDVMHNLITLCFGCLGKCDGGRW